MMRVLLVDDQDLVRAGFRMILSVEPEIEVVGEAADGEKAVELALQLRPDVVLMDVQMPGMDGITATQKIVAADAGKVIILTTFDRDDYLFESLGAGASGFLLKNTAPEDLVEAIQIVHEGHALLAPEVTRRVIKRFSGGGERVYRPDLIADLTDREREVLGLIARGLTNTEIANQLYVGEATVKTHVSRVLLKLGLRDRVQAVVFAYECGLVSPGDDLAG
ncbi:response regulator transcription factor [Kribbella antibiotica]|uniref:Response regulator transcription factor n=1 Tax=Kribbella antibiotica TaxID=190195 RepID=A0A4R4YZ65_9ACTN|nr:response regulator transcription factor [Kribbella antibiotica]TDD49779.1 response regulator transcription factor [Kribbella antibiotica]